MTLNEMRSLLESRGIQLTKSLGQNFLHDGLGSGFYKTGLVGGPVQ